MSTIEITVPPILDDDGLAALDDAIVWQQVEGRRTYAEIDFHDQAHGSNSQIVRLHRAGYLMELIEKHDDLEIVRIWSTGSGSMYDSIRRA